MLRLVGNRFLDGCNYFIEFVGFAAVFIIGGKFDNVFCVGEQEFIAFIFVYLLLRAVIEVAAEVEKC